MNWPKGSSPSLKKNDMTCKPASDRDSSSESSADAKVAVRTRVERRFARHWNNELMMWLKQLSLQILEKKRS
jgi:hypothetical protein